MANPVSWFEITGKDADKLQQFYADVFGWEYQQAPGPTKYGMISAGNGGIGGGVGEAQGGPGHVTVYVEVDDPQAAQTPRGVCPLSVERHDVVGDESTSRWSRATLTRARAWRNWQTRWV